MSKVVEKLNKLGLTKNESQIYLAILELGKTNVSKIAQHTNINRRNIYDTLSTLLDKGLLFQIIGEKEGIYAGVDPDKLIELIQSKEIALEAIMPELEKRYQTQKVTEKIVIYKGIDGFKNYLEDILTTGENVYCLGAKGGWSFSELGDFADWFEQERIRKKIKVFNLFDQEMHDIVLSKKPLYNTYAEYRLLPKEFSTNSGLDVFGDKVVTFTGLYPEKFDEDVTLFVLTNQDIADAFRIWFQFMWAVSAGK